MSDYFDEKIQDADKRIDGNLDRLLGKGLNLPFVNTNSGPRKIMSGDSYFRTITIIIIVVENIIQYNE